MRGSERRSWGICPADFVLHPLSSEYEVQWTIQKHFQDSGDLGTFFCSLDYKNRKRLIGLIVY
jgi:hypothetical protein